MKTHKFTLVQHSAWTAKRDPQFRFAVEERSLNTLAEVALVEKVGGLIFDNYIAASDAAEDENYPPEVEGMIPRVRGDFKGNLKGEAIYIPRKEKNDTASTTGDISPAVAVRKGR